MTRDETKKIIMVMCASYPNYKPTDLSMTVDAWTTMLEEYSYSQVSAALKAFITSTASGFAPSVGELIERIHMISEPQELNDMEAWSLVSRALRNGYYGAEEEFDKLPPVVQKAVGSPSQLRNWSQTDSDSVENVIQSNFIKTYRIELARAKEISKMPSNIKELIDKANVGRFPVIPQRNMPEIEQKPIEKVEGVEMPESVSERYNKLKEEWN